jgi:hypothetical protein
VLGGVTRLNLSHSSKETSARTRICLDGWPLDGRHVRQDHAHQEPSLPALCFKAVGWAGENWLAEFSRVESLQEPFPRGNRNRNSLDLHAPIMRLRLRHLNAPEGMRSQVGNVAESNEPYWKGMKSDFSDGPCVDE